MPGGEFYTPRGIADLLVDLADPRLGDRIMDPACGTGSVLAAAARHLAERGPVGGNSFEAYAVDRNNVRPAMLNLALHGVPLPEGNGPTAERCCRTWNWSWCRLRVE